MKYVNSILNVPKVMVIWSIRLIDGVVDAQARYFLVSLKF